MSDFSDSLINRQMVQLFPSFAMTACVLRATLCEIARG